MRQKISFIVLIAFIAIALFTPKESYAEEKASYSSAKIQSKLARAESDYRVNILRKYLQTYNSPLAENAEDFVKYADIYNLDWKFVAAISGVESTFGHNIPNDSYNGWGWGVYGDNVTRFSSWEEGILTVSKGLRENYMDKWGAQNVYEIGRIYAASPRWAGNVMLYMNRIQDFTLKNTMEAIPLSI